ncbi:MAG: serine/threonine protein kinase [Polyangiaceae bacterium]|nr:serine/threonine protein kinase [Polyangiaceae bacterium]
MAGDARISRDVDAPRADASVCHVATEILLGRYRLTDVVTVEEGVEIWAGEHLLLKRPALIKFLTSDERGDSEAAQAAIERFRFEAQVSALLCARSQHIVTIHDADVGPSGPFLVIERDRGVCLADVLRYDAPLAPARVLHIVEQIGEALTAAHHAGIVHRDVRPANVWISSSAAVPDFAKLGNFIFAKSIDPRASLDRPPSSIPGVVVGTPSYMSPEQVLGEVADPSIDRWALAVLAYEALTGARPFDAETGSQTMIGVLTRPPTPPSKHRSDLSPAIDAFFERALDKEIKRRFSNVRDMLTALRQAIDDDAVSRAAAVTHASMQPMALTPLPPPPASRWVSVRRAGQASFVMVALLALTPLVPYLMKDAKPTDAQAGAAVSDPARAGHRPRPAVTAKATATATMSAATSASATTSATSSASPPADGAKRKKTSAKKDQPAAKKDPVFNDLERSLSNRQ